MTLWRFTPPGWFCCSGDYLRGQRPFRFDNKKTVFVLFWALFALAFYGRIPRSCLALCPVLTALLQLSLSDVFYKVLQDQWEIFIALLGILRTALSSGGLFAFAALQSRRLAAALLFILLWILSAFLSSLADSQIPFGFGDAKLLASCCLLFGAEKTLIGAALAFILAGIYAAALLIFKRTQKKDRISFGPFICLGIIYCLLPTP